MIIPIGLYWRFKKLGVITFRHPACGDNLDCTVEEARQRFTIFLIPIIRTDRRYLFSWEGCARSFAIVDKVRVEEYRTQMTTAGGLPIAPDMDALVPHQAYRPTSMPVNWKNCLFVVVAAILMFLCGALIIGYQFVIVR